MSPSSPAALRQLCVARFGSRRWLETVSDTGESWRAVLFKYNATPGNNSLHLLPAWQLYNNKTYGMLADHCGLDRLFILSAGWGLVRADFLIPAYDITFSPNGGMYKRRRNTDCYDDSNMLPKSQEVIVFFGGKDYVSLFCTLSSDARGRRTVWYNSGSSGNRVDRGVSGRHRRGRDQDRRGESRWRCGSACGYESRALSISASARPR